MRSTAAGYANMAPIAGSGSRNSKKSFLGIGGRMALSCDEISSRVQGDRVSDYVAIIEKAQRERDAALERLARATKLIEEGNLAMATLVNHETALRRIRSLDEKNVSKYAQQIAKEALANNLITVTPESAMHAGRLNEIIKRASDTGDHMLSLQDAHTLTEAACYLAGDALQQY